MALDNIIKEVKQGLQCDKWRHEQARTRNLDYYRGHFDLYRYRVPDAGSWGDRCNRSSLLMQRIVNTSTAFLYRDDPSRVVKGHPQITEELQRIYKYNNICAKWQAADRLTWIGQAAAFQVAGTDDPRNPIKIHLWAPHAFSVFVADDDPLKVEGVVTIDQLGDRKRYTLYTDAFVQVYLDQDAKLGDDAAVLVGEYPNSYGVIPFTFAHYETPVIEWWSGSPGTVLREINDYVIYRLTELADGVKNLIFPKLVGYNLDPVWRAPQPWLPGIIAQVPGSSSMEGGTQKEPKIEALTPPLGFVQETWVDLDKYINHSLECAGVPEAAIRMVQSVARSGASIAQEQAPLVNESRKRQRPFLQYETDLARLVLQVLLAHSANNGIARHDLAEALDDFELSMRWGEYYSAIPGPERDRADAYNLQNGYSSRIMVLQERHGFTHEEAVSFLERVEKDHEEESKLLDWLAGKPLQSVTEPNTSPEPGSDNQDDLEESE